jgi:hypothetical protein
MRTLPQFHDRREREQRSAVGAFLAGLPPIRGRVLTASSDPDSWRRKHPAILRRLEAARQWSTR